jgi:hypothetical protein
MTSRDGGTAHGPAAGKRARAVQRVAALRGLSSAPISDTLAPEHRLTGRVALVLEGIHREVGDEAGNATT